MYTVRKSREILIKRFVVSSWNGINNTLLYLEQLVTCDEYELLYNMLHGADGKYKFLAYCQRCETWYLTNHRTRRFCSDNCRYRNREKRHKVKGVCVVCGEEFWGRADRKYCTHECRNKDYYVRVIKAKG
jgi:hypothetical protein